MPNLRGMAHLPIGNGECGNCVNLIGASSLQKGRCLLWAEFTGRIWRLDALAKGDPNWWREWPAIHVATQGCKYHEPTIAYRGAKSNVAEDSASGGADDLNAAAGG